jgi:transposase
MPSKPKYIAKLTDDERVLLDDLTRKGKCAARTLKRAQILLKAADGWQDDDIMQALDVSASMVYDIRKRCVEEGPEAALHDRPRPGQRRKLDDRQAAHLIAVACSAAPEGHDHWTLRLLADKVVELGFADSFSHEAVRQLLKKTRSSPGKCKSGASPRSVRTLWPRWRMS